MKVRRRNRHWANYLCDFPINLNNQTYFLFVLLFLKTILICLCLPMCWPISYLYLMLHCILSWILCSFFHFYWYFVILRTNFLSEIAFSLDLTPLASWNFFLFFIELYLFYFANMLKSLQTPSCIFLYISHKQSHDFSYYLSKQLIHIQCNICMIRGEARFYSNWLNCFYV